MAKLETLLMRRTALDDRALEALTPLQALEHLDVSSTSIADRSVPSILGFQTLQSLGFEHVRVSQAAAERLFELPKLQNLEIWLDGVDGEHWHRFIKDRPGFHLEA